MARWPDQRKQLGTIVAFIFIIYLRVFLILYKAQRRFITFDEEAHRDGIPNDGDALAAPTPKIHKTDDSLGDNTTSGNNKNGGIRQNRKFKKVRFAKINTNTLKSTSGYSFLQADLPQSLHQLTLLSYCLVCSWLA